MRRREFIAGLGGVAAWPLVARAQQSAMPVIGFLSARSPVGAEGLVAAYKEGLAEAGYVSDQDVAIDFRWAEGQYELLPALAADLVSRRVAVIGAFGGILPILAAKAATSTIPIVFTTGSDPVSSGLVASISRPDGNVTGFYMFSGGLEAKRKHLYVDVTINTDLIQLFHCSKEGLSFTMD
jgi:putative ABC transport system substrate-binding protein